MWQRPLRVCVLGVASPYLRFMTMLYHGVTTELVSSDTLY